MPTVELFFREYGCGEKVLVILHGLLGSSQNWQRAAKTLGEKYRVLVVDQRNHGDSPHTPSHTFADLREDIRYFFDLQHLDTAYLLGHSMGGIAAMEFAFHYPERLSGLIIEDIAPRAYTSSSGDILQALCAMNLGEMTSRHQADAWLASTIKSRQTRQFLLTNLVRLEDHSFAWKVNLPALQQFQRERAAYQPPPSAPFTGQTLFIGGALSDYRLDHDHEVILQHFPNSKLVMIPSAGHWIHFEALEPFTRTITRFIEHGLMAFNE
ncbi:MAG: alpha/beta fold hydrolase [candidate division KSB1 bacterium]|nr:alpha/beta fold hydrolase [candidate division KSB1 bacterium]